MQTGAAPAEDASGSPRLTAELMKMSRTIGELASTQKSTAEKVNEVHRAIFLGNHKPSIMEWLLKHDNEISKLLGRTREQRQQTVKTVGYSGLGLTALVLALKLAVYLLTGHWPTVP